MSKPGTVAWDFTFLMFFLQRWWSGKSRLCSATPQIVLRVYSEFVDAEMTPKFSDVQRGMQKNGDISKEEKCPVWHKLMGNMLMVSRLVNQ